MSMCDPATLSAWVSKYKANKHDLLEFGLNYAFDLTSHAINSGLLAHMRTRWNPTTTSFHIGGKQICPTLEEFQAILFMDDPFLMSLPPLAGAISCPSVFMKLVGTTKLMSQVVFKDQKIDLMGLSTIMFNKNRRPPISDQAWKICTVTVLLSHFFLAPSNSKPSAKVFEVAFELSRKYQNIAGLILAETLVGLNEPSRASEMSSRGSPHVLYVWLMEKLNFLPPVPSAVLTERQSFDRLEHSTPQPSVANSVCIRDLMPWYQIKKMMHSLDDMPIVTLLGLESSVSYHTSQLFGQFGRRSMPATKLPACIFDGQVTANMHKFYLNQIGRTARLKIEEPMPTIDHYLADAMMTKDKARDKSNANNKRPTASGVSAPAPKPKKKRT